MPVLGVHSGAKTGNDSGSSNGWQQTWRRGHECGRCGRWGHYTIGSPGRGTLMRHRLIGCGLALTPTARALGMFEATAAAALVALCRLLLQGFAGDGCAVCSAVALATIAVTAHENGGAATRAQETSRWWLHRHSCTDEGWAGQRLMFREILTSATSPSRARGTASGWTCYGIDPVSCLLSLYRHAPFLTAPAPVGYISNLAANHHPTNPQGRVCTRPPGSCKLGLAVTPFYPLPPDLRAS